jgi:exopolyphosphatase/pppGpp-phosphohydrolase
MPEEKVIGAIDIGSNAIRMICVRLTEDHRIEELEKNRTPNSH